MTSQKFLTTKKDKIIGPDGNVLILRGTSVGGWMNMENFITGYPANEEAQRDAVRETLGNDLYEFYFEKFLEYFFAEPDAEFLGSLGLNLLRIPLNYRHFEDDAKPFKIKSSGFRHLDRAIAACAKHGIYTIIDLHALPGYQNQDWHSDNPTHKAMFWTHPHFQDRVVHIWEAFAERYKGNPWVAGYNPINEPADPSRKIIGPYYKMLIKAIRAIDKNHLIFLEGNRYSLEFDIFTETWPNVVYTAHDYAAPGRIDGSRYPGVDRGRFVDKGVLEKDFLEKCKFMFDNNLPIWIGEFAPVYTGNEKNDEWRYQLISDQLEIYTQYRVSWATWLYKDIGIQGLGYAAPESMYMRRTKSVREKKARLGADSWGNTDKGVRHIMAPIEELIQKEFPGYSPFPFTAPWQAKRLVRNILFSEPLLREWGAQFRGMKKPQIDAMMKSFLLKNCVKRTMLAAILKEYANK
jgi:aryl-phospho-beta-D-glucosidase BglC (GH1 family)